MDSSLVDGYIDCFKVGNLYIMKANLSIPSPGISTAIQIAHFSKVSTSVFTVWNYPLAAENQGFLQITGSNILCGAQVGTAIGWCRGNFIFW